MSQQPTPEAIESGSAIPAETIEDVRTSCIALTHLAERLGGDWHLSASGSTNTTKVITVRLWIPVPVSLERAIGQLDVSGDGGAS